MITQSKLRQGTLTLDAVPFETQAVNVRLVPATEENGEAVEALSGDTIGADESTTWTLAVESVQDFDDPTGFASFCFDNDGLAVPFVWAPNNTTTGVEFAGSLTVRAIEMGGPVNTRNNSEAEFPVIGTPTRTFRTGV